MRPSNRAPGTTMCRSGGVSRATTAISESSRSVMASIRKGGSSTATRGPAPLSSDRACASREGRGVGSREQDGSQWVARFGACGRSNITGHWQTSRPFREAHASAQPARPRRARRTKASVRPEAATERSNELRPNRALKHPTERSHASAQPARLRRARRTGASVRPEAATERSNELRPLRSAQTT